MPSSRDNLTGQRFGTMVVVDRAEGYKWRCLCDCGQSAVVDHWNLSLGRQASCGCLKRKHGKSNCKAYRAWSAMIERCTVPTHKSFHRYGGRGIAVCERWRSDFRNFLADMGEPEPGLSLDRIDNDRGYEPGNCRWTTAKVQANNRTSNPTHAKLDRRHRMQIAWLVNARGYTCTKVADLFGVSISTAARAARNARV